MLKMQSYRLSRWPQLCREVITLCWKCLSLNMHAGQDGNVGKVQFREIPGPAYVSADVPGRGIRPRNAFALKNGVGAVPNIGPIKNATAYGETAPFLPCMSACSPCSHDAHLSSRACAMSVLSTCDLEYHHAEAHRYTR